MAAKTSVDTNITARNSIKVICRVDLGDLVDFFCFVLVVICLPPVFINKAIETDVTGLHGRQKPGKDHLSFCSLLSLLPAKAKETFYNSLTDTSFPLCKNNCLQRLRLESIYLEVGY
jgi:hypothetical protein